MNSKNKKLKLSKVLRGALLIGMLSASIPVLTSCVASNKTVIHPLAEDFRLVTAGEIVEVKKNGALVSDYWLSEVASVEIEK